MHQFSLIVYLTCRLAIRKRKLNNVVRENMNNSNPDDVDLLAEKIARGCKVGDSEVFRKGRGINHDTLHSNQQIWVERGACLSKKNSSYSQNLTPNQSVILEQYIRSEGNTVPITVPSQRLDLGYPCPAEGKQKHHYHPFEPPCLPAVFLEGMASGEDIANSRVEPESCIKNYRKYQFW
jgi:hypothetical protein